MKNWPKNGKQLNLQAPLKKSNGIKYITQRSPQILNTGTYRKIFGDFSLAQMGDCMGIFNRPSDFSLAMGDWESLSLENGKSFLWKYFWSLTGDLARRNTGTHQNTLITNSNHWNTLWILAMGIVSSTI